MEKNKKTAKVEKTIDYRLIIVGVAVALIVIIALVLLLTNKSKDNKEKPKDKESGIEVKTDENTMEKDYGFSKEDAINKVKESYQSDNYTFTAVANDDNTYTVIVENEENGEVTKWTVDPSDGSRSMDS